MENQLNALTPKRLIARINGSKVIVNSIPKGGTHVLIRCLSLFPKFSYSGIHFTRGPAGSFQLEPLLRKNGKGRFMAAHLWWSEECAALLREYDFKTILMLRDPRDIVISGIFFILKRKDHHLHEYFSRLPDMDARINAYMTGVEGSESSKGIGLANIRDSFGNYTPWIEENYNLLVRYEDMIGPRGGGESAKQIEQIKRISDHLNASLLSEHIHFISNKIFSTRSVTFRKGGSGEWRNYFSPHHIRRFKDLAGQILTDFGYEKDNEWK